MRHPDEATIERQRRALELRLAGATYDAIAAELGYSQGSGACSAVNAALARRKVDVADDVLATEIARLDAMLLGLWTSARKGNVNAIDRVLRISERRLSLLALLGDQAETKPDDEVSPVDELRARRTQRHLPAASDQ